jgi:hypothetical protein
VAHLDVGAEAAVVDLVAAHVDAPPLVGGGQDPGATEEGVGIAELVVRL